MKIVLAPNAFKGSLTATEAAGIMAKAIHKVYPAAEIVQVPVADGGDGLAEVLVQALDGETRTVTVTGPLGDPVEASFCYAPRLNMVAIEMAAASGLRLLSEEQRNPLSTTTYGTGELIRAALDLAVSHIVVGIGGSATNDGGIGMAAALGVRFLDQNGHTIESVGGRLHTLHNIDLSGLDERIHKVRLEVICDVQNPLLGEQGASHVYGPQKGASPEQVETLEEGMRNLAAVIESDLGLDVRDMPGAGAAGGLGAGLRAFLGAELRRGVDLVIDLVGLEEKLQGADLVLTTEGRIDRQTASGKAPAGVAKCARARNIPCIAIAGCVGGHLEELYGVGIDAAFSLCPAPVTMEQAMAKGKEYLFSATEQVIRCFLVGRGQRMDSPEVSGKPIKIDNNKP